LSPERQYWFASIANNFKIPDSIANAAWRLRIDDCPRDNSQKQTAQLSVTQEDDRVIPAHGRTRPENMWGIWEL
jgi:hypothetical protein